MEEKIGLEFVKKNENKKILFILCNMDLILLVSYESIFGISEEKQRAIELILELLKQNCMKIGL